MSNLRLIDVAAEDEVVHIGNGSNRGTVVEGISQDHGVTHLHGDIEDDTRDGRADQCGRGRGISLRDTVAHHLQGVFGSRLLLLGLMEGLLDLVVFISRDELLIVEVLLTIEVHLCLLQIDL